MGQIASMSLEVGVVIIVFNHHDSNVPMLIVQMDILLSKQLFRMLTKEFRLIIQIPKGHFKFL